MEELFRHIVELALKEGLWACLFLYLFRRMLSENKEREAAYQATIREFTTNINMEIVEMNGKLDRALATTTADATITAGITAGVANPAGPTEPNDAISRNGENNACRNGDDSPTEDREKGKNNEYH